MPQSLAQVYVHIVFATKIRYPSLSEKNIRYEMHAYLGGTCNNMDCRIIAVGGFTDHVHILCKLTRNLSIAKVVGEIKRSSSKWIKTKGSIYKKFAWQNGYGVFSIGRTEVDIVKKYIEEQEEHHRKKSFQDEYREFLKTYDVEYDERYVWD